MPNGQVKNHSSKALWVVETDSGAAIAHQLAPGRQSPGSVDADGFRAVDGTPVDNHTAWVKVVDLSTADVAASGAQLTRGCVLCYNASDNEFGQVTFDNAAGWGEPIVESRTVPVNAPRSMSPHDFVRALREGEFRPAIVREGLAKVESGDSESLLFSEGRGCRHWTRIPLDAIERIDYAGFAPCHDHEHPLVRLHLRTSIDDSTAALFAELQRNSQSAGATDLQISADWKEAAAWAAAARAATQRIDIRLQANGDGTLSCGAGTFPCQGQPGRRYPTDLIVTTADKYLHHYSNEFQCWMDYSILIWGQKGIYIHQWSYCHAAQGPSAGCIHLCPGAAATVYNWIAGRTRITISYPW